MGTLDGSPGTIRDEHGLVPTTEATPEFRSVAMRASGALLLHEAREHAVRIGRPGELEAFAARHDHCRQAVEAAQELIAEQARA